MSRSSNELTYEGFAADAALELFASIAFLFSELIVLLMPLQSDD
jgi:hypothetical protein